MWIRELISDESLPNNFLMIKISFFSSLLSKSTTLNIIQVVAMINDVYIDITAALRAVFYIARVLACNIKYLHEGASPRRRYFRIARRAQRARVLYDNTALKCEDDIVYIHQRAYHQVDMEYI